jgi:hypothetical protein
MRLPPDLSAMLLDKLNTIQEKFSLRKKISFHKKHIFILFILVTLIFAVSELKKRISIRVIDGKTQILLSKDPIKNVDSTPITIKPGYYYSKALKINIYVPERFSGDETLGIITFKKSKEVGEIVIERKPKKYNSLEDGIRDIEKGNPKLMSIAKKSDFNNINGYEGKAYTVKGSDIYLYQYLIYADSYIYSFYTQNPSLFLGLHEFAFRFKYSDSPITPPVKRVYDFEKIIKENFLRYENEEFGFSIDYPPVAQQSELSIHSIQNRHGTQAEEKYLGGKRFDLIAQPPGAYELYDALVVDIIYFDNTYRKNLNQFVEQFINFNPEYGTGTKLEGDEAINGNIGKKLTYCCYAGGSTMYFFSNKNKNYIIGAYITPYGPDSEKYTQIAEKMIQSIQIDN